MYTRMIVWSLLAALCHPADAAAQSTQPLQQQNPPANPLLALSSIMLQSDDPRSAGVEVTAASRGLSFELAQTFQREKTPIPPSLRLKQTRLSQEELGAVVWMNAHRDEIAAAEDSFQVPRQVIAGVIAWEALENVAPLSVRSVGPGKVHICNMTSILCGEALLRVCGGLGSRCPPDVKGIDETVAQEVELLGYLPLRNLQERIDLLSTSAGAIHYIGAILRAGADAAKDAGWDIEGDPALLVMFYRGYTVRAWRARLRTADRTSRRLIFRDANGREIVDEMGAWIQRNAVLLADGVGASALVPTSSTGSFLSDAARAAANQPDVKGRIADRDDEIRQPDTSAEDAARAERRAAAWEYLRATLQLACSNPAGLKSLRDQRRVWGVVIARDTAAAFFNRDRDAMSTCAKALVEATLSTSGPADVKWIEKQGRKYFEAEQHAARRALDRQARLERAAAERQRANDNYDRAEARVSTSSGSSTGSGRLGSAYGQGVGIAGGRMGIYDGR